MPRLGSFKRTTLFASAISLIAGVINARELECSYDYTTHKEVRTLSETQDASEGCCQTNENSHQIAGAA